MVNGGVAVQGRHYRVISSNTGFSNLTIGDEVVSLEDDDMPYCVLADKFNGCFEIDSYYEEELLIMTTDELEEMEENSSEIKD